MAAIQVTDRQYCVVDMLPAAMPVPIPQNATRHVRAEKQEPSFPFDQPFRTSWKSTDTSILLDELQDTWHSWQTQRHESAGGACHVQLLQPCARLKAQRAITSRICRCMDMDTSTGRTAAACWMVHHAS